MAECLKINRGSAGGGSIPVVSWQNGTDAEIAAMIAAADAGQIDLSDYWSIGDERTVHLSAMTAGQGLNIAQPEQDVVLVLMDTGISSNYKDANDNIVNFVVGQKNCLTKVGSISNTYVDSWNGSAIRTDLNSKYYNALPETFRSCLKQFKTITANKYNSTTNDTSLDYIALFAEREVFGLVYKSNQKEAEALRQIEYYETSANRVKIVVSSDNKGWWLRSPNATRSGNSFCKVYEDGTPGSTGTIWDGSISPFMCI